MASETLTAFTSLQLYCFTILGLISFLSGFCLLWAYARIKSIREGPGMLILATCLCLASLAFYDCYSGFYHLLPGNNLQNSQSCRLHGLATVYLTVLYWNYSFSLALYVVFALQSYRKVSLANYHVASHTLSMLAVSVLYFSQETGSSLVTVCFVRQSAWGE